MYFVIIGFVSSCKTITPTTWKFTLVFSTKIEQLGVLQFCMLRLKEEMTVHRIYKLFFFAETGRQILVFHLFTPLVLYYPLSVFCFPILQSAIHLRHFHLCHY